MKSCPHGRFLVNKWNKLGGRGCPKGPQNNFRMSASGSSDESTRRCHILNSVTSAATSQGYDFTAKFMNIRRKHFTEKSLCHLLAFKVPQIQRA